MTTGRRSLAVLSALVAAAACAALADAGDLDEQSILQDIPTVVGASKYEEKLTEAPASVTMITAAEIRRYGWRTLADILRAVRGLVVTYDRNYSYVNVRGFGRPGDYNTRVLLLVDGHRLQDGVFDLSLIGTEAAVDVDLVEHVEIVRGPSSSVYGSSAFFGIVNVVTRHGRDLPGLRALLEAGSAGANRGRLTYGRHAPGGPDVLLSASRMTTRGRSHYFPEYDEPETNRGIADLRDGDAATSLFARIEAGSWRVQAGHYDRTKDVPTGSFGTDFNDPRNRTIDTWTYADATWTRTLDAGITLAGHAALDRYRYEGNLVYDGLVNVDVAKGSWWTGEFRVAGGSGRGHRWTVGAEYRRNARQDQVNYDLESSAVYLDDRRTSSALGVYAQDELSLGHGVWLNAGLRYDHEDATGGTVNPRLALLAELGASSTAKLLYGRAYRAPSAYERFYAFDGSSEPNPRLDAETIETLELVYEQYAGTTASWSASAYRSKVRDLIDLSTDEDTGLLVYRNHGRASATGLEVEGGAHWPGGTEARVSYALQRCVDDDTGVRMSNAPSQVLKFRGALPVGGTGVLAAVELQATSARMTPKGGKAAGFAVVNVTLSKAHVVKGVSLAFSVYNLLDADYADPGSREHREDVINQDGRTYRLGAELEF